MDRLQQDILDHEGTHHEMRDGSIDAGLDHVMSLLEKNQKNIAAHQDVLGTISQQCGRRINDELEELLGYDDDNGEYGFPQLST